VAKPAKPKPKHDPAALAAMEKLVIGFIPLRPFTITPKDDGSGYMVNIKYGGGLDVTLPSDPKAAKKTLEMLLKIQPKIGLASGSGTPSAKPIAPGAFFSAPAPGKSKASKETKVYNAAKLATEAIGKVHKMSGLPLLSITDQPSGGSAMAQYIFYGTSPHKITVKTSSSRMALNLAHEIGHFIDHQGLYGKGAWASGSSSSIAAPLMATIRESAAYKQLLTMYQTGKVETPNGTHKVNSKYMKYMVNAQELFARAYAQYIATRSGDPDMAQQLQKTVDTQGLYPAQWQADDFEPIAKAFDELFKQKGWA
jgi:hypothetical protein